MYNSLIAVTVIITVYFCLMAVVSHFRPGTAVFSAKSAICLVLGAILGGFIAWPLWSMSKTAGYAGCGAGVGLMYVLFFSGVLNTLLNMIPAKLRKGFKVAFNVIRVIAIATIIVAIAVVVLQFVGV